MTTREAITSIIERFQQIPILRIVVFGSVASGRTNADSDLDIAVVVPEPAAGQSFSRVELAVAFRRLIRDINAEMAIDILVYTKDEFDQLSRVPSFVKTELLDGGQTVYERAG